MKYLNLSILIVSLASQAVFAQVQAPEHKPGDKAERAKRLLDQLARQEIIRTKEREYMAKRLVQAGEQYVREERLQEAIVAFKKALSLAPDSEPTKKLLAEARHEAGLEADKNPSVLLRKIEAERMVAQQVTLHEMERLIGAGKNYFERKEYREAIDTLENARVLARSIQSVEGVEAQSKEAASLVSFSREAMRRDEILKRHQAQNQATTILQAERERQRRIVKGRKDLLTHRIRSAMEQENYDVANNLVDELLAVDPLNATARGLKAQLSRGERYDRQLAARGSSARNKDELLIQTDEAASPITGRFKYSTNWAEMSQRRRKSHSAAEDLPQWKIDVMDQMEKRVSFDFLDTPLADVVAFLQNLTGVNMLVDPAAIEGDDIPVTLKVSDMKLGAALDWILRLVNLQYALQDEAIFISTAERVRQKDVLRIYDVRDLLAIIPDYAGSGLPGIGDGGGGGDAGGLFDDDGGGDGERFTGEDLVEFIQETIAPGSWGDGEDDF